MKFTVVKEPIPFLIIDDTYDSEERTLIYKELDYLFDKLQGAEETSSALNFDGSLKKNTGLFLESVYTKRQYSNILNVNRKLFNSKVIDHLVECHYAYNLIGITNSDNTLISYYDEGGSYFSHVDNSVITIVNWFFKTPKNFTGGEFKFTDYNLNIELKNNRTIIFFSSFKHEVSEVTIVDKSVPVSGRFTLTNFCNIK